MLHVNIRFFIRNYNFSIQCKIIQVNNFKLTRRLWLTQVRVMISSVFANSVKETAEKVQTDSDTKSIRSNLRDICHIHKSEA